MALVPRLVALPAACAALLSRAASGHRVQAPRATALLEAGQELPPQQLALGALLPAAPAPWAVVSEVPPRQLAFHGAARAHASTALFSRKHDPNWWQKPGASPWGEEETPGSRRDPFGDNGESWHEWDGNYESDGTYYHNGKRYAKPEPEKQTRASAWPGRVFGGDPKAVAQVPARNMQHYFQGDPWRNIALPARWVWQLQPGSVSYCPGGEFANPRFYGIAKLSGTKSDVKFGSWVTKDPKTRRHICLSQILSSSGVVPKVLDTMGTSELTYVITECTGTHSLAEKIGEWQREKRPAGESVVPLETALPLMVDMLRALEVLQERNIAHADLNERNIYVLDRESHTVIDDLRNACLLGKDGDADVGCKALEGKRCGSAFRHAPEMTDGIPTSTTNNVWQLGLVCARLLLGDIVPAWAEGYDDFDDKSRAAIRRVTREHFALQDVDGFDKIKSKEEDVVQIVEGMLDKDPSTRITPKEARELVEAAAKKRGIKVFGKRSPPEIPQEIADELAGKERTAPSSTER